MLSLSFSLFLLIFQRDSHSKIFWVRSRWEHTRRQRTSNTYTFQAKHSHFHTVVLCTQYALIHVLRLLARAESTTVASRRRRERAQVVQACRSTKRRARTPTADWLPLSALGLYTTAVSTVSLAQPLPGAVSVTTVDRRRHIILPRPDATFFHENQCKNQRRRAFTIIFFNFPVIADGTVSLF